MSNHDAGWPLPAPAPQSSTGASANEMPDDRTTEPQVTRIEQCPNDATVLVQDDNRCYCLVCGYFRSERQPTRPPELAPAPMGAPMGARRLDKRSLEDPHDQTIGTAQSSEEQASISRAAASEGTSLPTQPVLPRDPEKQNTIEEISAMPPSIFVGIKESFHKNTLARHVWEIAVVMSGVVLGVIFAIYGPVFLEAHEWKTALWGPTAIEQASFSDLMSDHRSDRESLYVFALDVSGSLYQSPVSESEKIWFENRIKADGFDSNGATTQRCGLSGSNLTKWDLARAQICYYLHSLRGKAGVGLWKFGKDPSRGNHRREEKLEEGLLPTEPGALQQIIDRLMADDMIPKKNTPDFDKTDFESLFNRLDEEYVQDPDYRNKDVRLVIVSDFLQDAETPDRFSLDAVKQRIAGKLAEFRKAGNVTFHLVVIGPHEYGGSEPRFILPLIKEALKWDQQVVDFLDRGYLQPMPNFLYGFSRSEKELLFHHAVDAESVHPIQIVWDEGMPATNDNRLAVELIRDDDNDQAADMSLYVSEGAPIFKSNYTHSCGAEITPQPGFQSATLTPEQGRKRQGGMSFNIRRPGDWLCLQPLPARRDGIYNYKLTLTCASDRTHQNVNIIKVRLQKYIPRSAAWVIVGCVALIMAASFYFATAMLVTLIRDRSSTRRRLSAPTGTV